MSNVKQYRKKPVVIEAVQLVDGIELKEIKEFVGGSLHQIDGGSLLIRTLEGDMHVSPNDYIIKGVQGEFYPCKPDIFEATYEPVELTEQTDGEKYGAEYGI